MEYYLGSAILHLFLPLLPGLLGVICVNVCWKSFTWRLHFWKWSPTCHCHFWWYIPWKYILHLLFYICVLMTHSRHLLPILHLLMFCLPDLLMHWNSLFTVSYLAFVHFTPHFIFVTFLPLLDSVHTLFISVALVFKFFMYSVIVLCHSAFILLFVLFAFSVQLTVQAYRDLQCKFISVHRVPVTVLLFYSGAVTVLLWWAFLTFCLFCFHSFCWHFLPTDDKLSIPNTISVCFFISFVDYSLEVFHSTSSVLFWCYVWKALFVIHFISFIHSISTFLFIPFHLCCTMEAYIISFDPIHIPSTTVFLTHSLLFLLTDPVQLSSAVESATFWAQTCP